MNSVIKLCVLVNSTCYGHQMAILTDVTQGSLPAHLTDALEGVDTIDAGSLVLTRVINTIINI